MKESGLLDLKMMRCTLYWLIMPHFSGCCSNILNMRSSGRDRGMTEHTWTCMPADEQIATLETISEWCEKMSCQNPEWRGLVGKACAWPTFHPHEEPNSNWSERICKRCQMKHSSMWVTQHIGADSQGKSSILPQTADLSLSITRPNNLLVFEMQTASTHPACSQVDKTVFHHESFGSIQVHEPLHPRTIEVAKMNHRGTIYARVGERYRSVHNHFGLVTTAYTPNTMACHICGYENINPNTGKCDRCGL